MECVDKLLQREREDFLAIAARAGFSYVMVHDEAIFDVPEDRYNEFMELAIKYMGKVDDA